MWRKNAKYEAWLKQINSLPRHDDSDDEEEEKDNDYDEADYGEDDEDDVSRRLREINSQTYAFV